MKNIQTQASMADLESSLRRFEQSWAETEGPAIEEFLPSPDHPDFASILVELVRSDIEFRNARRQTVHLESYFDRFPKVFSEPRNRQAIAFEDFRTRQEAGVPRRPSYYEKEFGIDVSSWPAPEPSLVRDQTSGEVTLQFRRIREFSIGEQILDFEIVENLGRGAAGSVYVARQRSLANRLVAIKVSEHSYEPQVLAQLQHTNIMPVFSMHRLENLQILCMPLLGLVTLEDIVSAEGAREASNSLQALISTLAETRVETLMGKPRDTAAHGKTHAMPTGIHRRPVLSSLPDSSRSDAWSWIFLRIAEGLRHAHSAAVLHKDLKPGNVLIADNGEPLILDFHLSSRPDLIGHELIGGTLSYMSPEQLRQFMFGTRIDQRSDIYSFGVMLYRTLTGKFPFPNRDMELTELIPEMVEDRRAVPEPIHRIQPLARPSISSIAQRCLEFDPSKRYQSADQLVEDLTRLRAHRPLRYASNHSLRERLYNWTVRHPRISSASSIGVFAAMMLTLATIAWWFQGKRLAGMEAERAFGQFENFVETSIAELSVGTQDIARFRARLSDIEQQLGDWQATSLEQLGNSDTFRRISDAHKREMKAHAGYLNYWVSESNRRLMRIDSKGDPKRQARALAQIQFAADAITAPAAARWIQRERLLIEGKDDDSAPFAAKMTASPDGMDDGARLICSAASLREGRLDEAAELLQPLVHSNPTNPTVWFLKSLIDRDRHRIPQALASLDVCVSLAPSEMAFKQRGILYLLMQNYEAAWEDFDEAIRQNETNPEHYLNRGLAALGVQKFEDAEKDFSKAIELQTSETRVYFLRSRTRTGQGKRAAAIEDFEKGLSLAPTDELSWLARGVANVRRNPEQAIDDFECALQINPRSVEALQNLAHMYAEQKKDNRRGIGYLEQIMAIHPEDADTLATIGVLYAREGQETRAVSSGEEAIAIANTPEIRYRVAGIFALLSPDKPPLADRAIELLVSAASENPRLVFEESKVDPDLEALRKNPSYEKLVESLNMIFEARRN